MRTVFTVFELPVRSPAPWFPAVALNQRGHLARAHLHSSNHLQRDLSDIGGLAFASQRSS